MVVRKAQVQCQPFRHGRSSVSRLAIRVAAPRTLKGALLQSAPFLLAHLARSTSRIKNRRFHSSFPLRSVPNRATSSRAIASRAGAALPTSDQHVEFLATHSPTPTHLSSLATKREVLVDASDHLRFRKPRRSERSVLKSYLAFRPFR